MKIVQKGNGLFNRQINLVYPRVCFMVKQSCSSKIIMFYGQIVMSI